MSRYDDDGCPILHVDMDAFYASVEVRRRPELRGRPVIVGGGSRGVVLSATYEAREFGVHSAMPMARALRRCPQAVVVPPDMASYAAASVGVMAVFGSVTPLVEPLSLDEAFLDVGGARRRLGRPAQIGEWIRARVADEQGITCSVGVAATKFMAKLASAHCKPDGLLVVPAGAAVDFLHPLPVAALWGVGDRTAELLQRLGLRTVGDLARTPASTLRRVLGPAAAEHLAALAAGRDDRRVVPNEPDKSIGAEETFGTDVDDPAIVQRELLRLAERTAVRLRSAGQVGRTVSIKVRFADFSTISRSRTLHTATDAGQEIYQTACALYTALGLDRALIRLVGVRVEGISAATAVPAQLELGAREHGWRDADRAVDRAAQRYGAGAVRPATLVQRADESERTGHFGATFGAHRDSLRPPTGE
jgi:DNA polymerase IV